MLVITRGYLSHPKSPLLFRLWKTNCVKRLRRWRSDAQFSAGPWQRRTEIFHVFRERHEALRTKEQELEVQFFFFLKIFLGSRWLGYLGCQAAGTGGLIGVSSSCLLRAARDLQLRSRIPRIVSRLFHPSNFSGLSLTKNPTKITGDLLPTDDPPESSISCLICHRPSYAIVCMQCGCLSVFFWFWPLGWSLYSL